MSIEHEYTDLEQDYRDLGLVWNELDKQHAKLQKHSRNQRAALRRFNKTAQVIYMGDLYGRYVARGSQVRELEFRQRRNRLAAAWGFFWGCVVVSSAFVVVMVVV